MHSIYTVIRNFLIIILTSALSAFGKVEGDIKTYSFDEFKTEVLYSSDSQSLLVINFWATWCGPCVREIPHFEEVNSNYSNKKVRIILVSLDFQNQYESKLIPFIREKDLKSELIWLNDTRYNTWIDQVSPEWSGAIPATVFIKNGKVLKFMEKELELEELENTINSLL